MSFCEAEPMIIITTVTGEAEFLNRPGLLWWSVTGKTQQSTTKGGYRKSFGKSFSSLDPSLLTGASNPCCSSLGGWQGGLDTGNE